MWVHDKPLDSGYIQIRVQVFFRPEYVGPSLATAYISCTRTVTARIIYHEIVSICSSNT